MSTHRALRAAERHAERAREKASAAVEMARAAAARVKSLGMSGGGAPAAAAAGSGTPASNIAATRLRRASSRMRQRPAAAGDELDGVGGLARPYDGGGVGGGGGGAPYSGYGDDDDDDDREPRVMSYDDPQRLAPTNAAEALEAERRQSLLLAESGGGGLGGDLYEEATDEGDEGDEGEYYDGDGDGDGGASGARGARRRRRSVFDSGAWVAAWRRGGLRGAGLAGHVPVQSDCLATDARDAEGTFVSIGGDGADDGLCVTLYSAIDGAAIRSLRGHTEKVVSVACEGDVIASGSRDLSIKLWSRSEADRVTTLRGCEGPPFGLCLRDGMLLSGEGGATGDVPNVLRPLRVWSIADAVCTATYAEHRGNVRTHLPARPPARLYMYTHTHAVHTRARCMVSGHTHASHNAQRGRTSNANAREHTQCLSTRWGLRPCVVIVLPMVARRVPARLWLHPTPRACAFVRVCACVRRVGVCAYARLRLRARVWMVGRDHRSGQWRSMMTAPQPSARVTTRPHACGPSVAAPATSHALLLRRRRHWRRSSIQSGCRASVHAPVSRRRAAATPRSVSSACARTLACTPCRTAAASSSAVAGAACQGYLGSARTWLAVACSAAAKQGPLRSGHSRQSCWSGAGRRLHRPHPVRRRLPTLQEPPSRRSSRNASPPSSMGTRCVGWRRCL